MDSNEGLTGKNISSAIEKLSMVDGITVSDGLYYCGNEQALEKFLGTFCGTIDTKSAEIEEAYKNSDIEHFTIKVHALKSTARIIGARKLSELALKLEEAGNKRDTAFIDENVEALLTQYRGYKEKLMSCISDDNVKERKSVISEDDIMQAYKAIKDFASQMDYDSIEMILEELDQYEIPDPEIAKLKRCRELFHNLEWEELEELM